MSSMGRPVSYEQAIAWKVLNDDDTPHMTNEECIKSGHGCLQHPDMMDQEGQKPWNNINFVCAHDGFTLAGLVIYNSKNNLTNGEENRDGKNHNFSWNCGKIKKLRIQCIASNLSLKKVKPSKSQMVIYRRRIQIKPCLMISSFTPSSIFFSHCCSCGGY